MRQTVREKAEEFGTTLTRMAEVLGVDRSTVYRWANEDFENMPIQCAVKLCKHWRLTPTEAYQIFLAAKSDKSDLEM